MTDTEPLDLGIIDASMTVIGLGFGYGLILFGVILLGAIAIDMIKESRR